MPRPASSTEPRCPAFAEHYDSSEEKFDLAFAGEPPPPQSLAPMLPGDRLRRHQERLTAFLRPWLAQQDRLLEQLARQDGGVMQDSKEWAQAVGGQCKTSVQEADRGLVSAWSGSIRFLEPEVTKVGTPGSYASEHSTGTDGKDRASSEIFASWKLCEQCRPGEEEEGDAWRPSSRANARSVKSNLVRTRSEEDRERQSLAKEAGMEKAESTAAVRGSMGYEALESGAGCLRRFALNPQFELFSLTVLLANTVFMGIELEYNVQNPGLEQPFVPFFVINTGFAAFFTLEVILRVLAQGRTFVMGENRLWNFIDSFAAAASLTEFAADTGRLVNGASGAQAMNESGQRMIKVVRVARLIRIFRITRVVKFVHSLRMLVYSIACTMKSLGWSLVLLGVIIYSCGIFFTQAVFDHLSELGAQGGGAADDQGAGLLRAHWGSLGVSMLTLFEAITGGVSWADVANPLADAHALCKMAFICFVAFSLLAVLNVVTAVFCQSAIDSAQRDQDAVLQSQMSNRKHYINWVRRCFEGIDTTLTGNITLAQLESHINDDRMQAFLASLEIETDDVWTLFKLLDADGSNAISLDEFATGCLRLRGAARSVDLALMSQDVQWLTNRLTHFIGYVEEQLDATEGELARRSGASPPRFQEPVPSSGLALHRRRTKAALDAK